MNVLSNNEEKLNNMTEKYRDNNTSPYSRFFTNAILLTVYAILAVKIFGEIITPSFLGSYWNPDTVTYPYLAYNLIYEHGHLSAWHVGSAPDFFPEIAFFYIISFFSINLITNLLYYCVFQIVAVVLLIPVLIYSVTRSRHGLRLGMLSTFVFLLYTLHFIEVSSTSIYSSDAYFNTLFAPGFHFSAFLSIIALTIFAVQHLHAKKTSTHVIFFMFLVLSGLSDPLVYVYFTFPMLISLSIAWIAKKINKSKYVTMAATLLIAFLIANILYRVLPLQYVRATLHPSFSPTLLLYFLKTIVSFYRQNIFFGNIWLLFLLLAPFSIKKSLQKKESTTLLIDYIILLQYITIIISTPLIILAISQVYPADQIVYPTVRFWKHPSQFFHQLSCLPYRYFINYFLGPIFIGFPLLLYKYGQGIVKYLGRNSFFIILLLSISTASLHFKVHHLSKLQHAAPHFQADLAACLEQYASNYHLTNGISDSYYAANLITAYTHGKLHVALVDSKHLMPVHWQNTEQLFEFNNYTFGLSQPPVEPFQNTLIDHFGKPLKTIICKGNFNDDFTIFIYPKGVLDHPFNV